MALALNNLKRVDMPLKQINQTFNAKAILIEGQLWYDSTYSKWWEEAYIMIFCY